MKNEKKRKKEVFKIGFLDFGFDLEFGFGIWVLLL